MKRFVLLAAMLPVMVFGAVNGEWKGQVVAGNIANTQQQHVLGLYANLSQAGATLTGTAGTQGQMLPIVNGTVSGNTLTFSVPEGPQLSHIPAGATPHMTTFNVTIQGANLVGTVTLFNRQQLAITMTPVTSK